MLLAFSLVFNLPRIRCRFSSSPLRVQGAAFRHGFPLAALFLHGSPPLGGHGGALPEELQLLLRASLSCSAVLWLRCTVCLHVALESFSQKGGPPAVNLHRQEACWSSGRGR